VEFLLYSNITTTHKIGDNFKNEKMHQHGKYISSQPSVDVPRGQVIRSDHLNLVDVVLRPIKNAKAIVIYNPHKVCPAQAKYNQYMNLSKRLNVILELKFLYIQISTQRKQ
jgi:hypothetical protein